MFLNFASQYQAITCDLCYEYSNSIVDPDTDEPFSPANIPDHIPRNLVRIVAIAEGCTHKFCLPCIQQAYLAPPFALIRASRNGYLPCPCPYCDQNHEGGWTLQDLFYILPRPVHKRLTQIYRQISEPHKGRIILGPLQKHVLSQRIRVAEFPHLPIYCLDCDTALEKTIACNEIRHCSFCYCWICGLACHGSIPADHWKTCPQFEHLYVKFGVAPSYLCRENHCYSDECGCTLLLHETGQKQLFAYRQEALLKTYA